ncbi:nitrilase family protein [Thalassoglobus sp. JC818]|uniref:nitrilase family protein n=1 Tax=Thalassoglobus sp. JC818 TaxID=3232136 RepID=UPI00345942C5
MNPIRAAAVQFNHVPGNKESNLEIIEKFVERAAQQNVDLLTFPEMCLTGYWHLRDAPREELERLAEPVPDGPSVQRLLELSRETGMSIGVGLIESGDDGKLYNSFVVALPDGNVHTHRKLHCFINQHMSSGDEFTVFDIPQGARVGVLICYDNNIGENVRATALKGAEILLSPHQTGGCNSPSPRCMGVVPVELWENRSEDEEALRKEFFGPKGRGWLMKWLPARAHDNGLFLVFANGVGRDDNEVRTGNSMILDPYGDVLIETKSVEDDMIVADLDPAVRKMCTGQRWLKTRRPELFKSLTERTGFEEDTRTVRFRHSPATDASK